MISKLERANGYYEIIEMFADGANVGQVKSIIKKQYGFELPWDYDYNGEHDDKICKNEGDKLLYEYGAENIQEVSVRFDEEQKEVIRKMRLKLRVEKENQLKKYLDHNFFYENELRIKMDYTHESGDDWYDILRTDVEKKICFQFPVIDLNENTGHEFDFSKSYFLEILKVPAVLKTGWIDDAHIKEKSLGVGSPFMYLLYGYYNHKFNEIGGEKMFECSKLIYEIAVLTDFTRRGYEKKNYFSEYYLVFIEMILFVLRENKFETTESIYDSFNEYYNTKTRTETIKNALLHYKEIKSLVYDLKKDVQEHLLKEKKLKEKKLQEKKNELDESQMPKNYKIVKNGDYFMVKRRKTILGIFVLWETINNFFSTESEAKMYAERLKNK